MPCVGRYFRRQEISESLLTRVTVWKVTERARARRCNEFSSFADWKSIAPARWGSLHPSIYPLNQSTRNLCTHLNEIIDTYYPHQIHPLVLLLWTTWKVCGWRCLRLLTNILTHLACSETVNISKSTTRLDVFFLWSFILRNVVVFRRIWRRASATWEKGKAS